jgi:hypothetical protein
MVVLCDFLGYGGPCLAIYLLSLQCDIQASVGSGRPKEEDN